MSDLERGWLAGLLEGEGSFFLQKTNVRGKYRYYPKITVVMTDLDIIERVSRIFGTSVYVMPASQMKQPHHKQQYRATLTGMRAAGIMVDIAPLMGQRRREKINQVLLDWESKKNES